MEHAPAEAYVALEQALLADEGLALGGRSVASAGTRLRIAVFTENFLPKVRRLAQDCLLKAELTLSPQVDGVTRTIARLLAHLKAHGHEAIVCGPETAHLERFCGHALVQTKGIPLLCYPGLKLNFFRPLFIRRLRAF